MTRALTAWTASDSAVSPVRLDMRISLVVIAVALLVAATLADDQATRLQEARTAVEANLKTREGKTYDEKLGIRVHGETSEHDEAVRAARGKRSGKLLDTHETRQRRRSEGSSVASCNQAGRVREGDAAQGYVLTTAARGVLGERVHEIDTWSLPHACANRDG